MFFSFFPAINRRTCSAPKSKSAMDKLWRRSTDMRGDHAIGCRPKRMARRQRLRVGDVQSCPDTILLQGLYERVSDNDRSTRRIHQQGARLHQADFCRSEHSTRLGRQRNDGDDDVGIRQQTAQISYGKYLGFLARRFARRAGSLLRMASGAPRLAAPIDPYPTMSTVFPAKSSPRTAYCPT